MKLKIKATDHISKEADTTADGSGSGRKLAEKLLGKFTDLGWGANIESWAELELYHGRTGRVQVAHFNVDLAEGISRAKISLITMNGTIRQSISLEHVEPRFFNHLQYRKIIRLLNGEWTVENLLKHSAELLAIFKRLNEHAVDGGS